MSVLRATFVLTAVLVNYQSVVCAPRLPGYLPRLEPLRKYVASLKQCLKDESCLVGIPPMRPPSNMGDFQAIEDALAADDEDLALTLSEKRVGMHTLFHDDLKASDTGPALKSKIEGDLSHGYFLRARALCRHGRHIQALIDLKRAKLLRRKSRGVSMTRLIGMEIEILDWMEEPFKTDLRDFFITDDDSDSVEVAAKKIMPLFEPLTIEQWREEYESLKLVHQVLTDVYKVLDEETFDGAI